MGCGKSAVLVQMVEDWLADNAMSEASTTAAPSSDDDNYDSDDVQYEDVD
jgi:hypothetical protein